MEYAEKNSFPIPKALQVLFFIAIHACMNTTTATNGNCQLFALCRSQSSSLYSFRCYKGDVLPTILCEVQRCCLA